MKRLVPVLALLLGAGVASAQSIGFETVGGGSTGPFGPAKNTVVKSNAELTSSGVRALLSPGAQLDFQNEMVIAVQMGTRNTGGYGIEVKGITRTQLASGGYALDVAVESRSPGPGDMVTMAITSPFHVVKLRRFANDQVRFVAPSAGAAFDVVERSISSMPRAEHVKVERATGKVVLTRSQFGSAATPIEGTATAAELDALASTLTTNDFKGLPASIPPPNPAPMDYPYLLLKVTGGSQAHEVRGLAGFHPASVAARLRAINGAIDAISSRIGTPPAFDVVERSISSLPRGEHVRIERATGRVVLQRTQINALIAPIEGTATAAELATLAAALVDNEFSDLPASLPPPNPAPMDVPYLRLKVTGGSQAHEVSGIAGFYPASLSARIRNIHAAIDPIVARLGSAPAAPFDEVRYTLSPGFPAGQATLSLSVNADASVQLGRSTPTAKFAPISGQATAAELAAVTAGVRRARLASVPTQLEVPVYIVAGDSFQLEVEGSDDALAGSTAGEPGYLQQHEARLRPLLAACEALIARLNVPQADEAKGVVRVAGNSVYLDEQPGVSYRLSGPVAATVRKFVGKTVKVEGTSLPSSGFEAKKLLYPETLTDEQVFPIPTGSGLHTYVRHEEVRVSGPAARVVTRLARGKAVKVDGFLFLGGPQASTPEEVFAERVAATVDAYTVLTRLGQPAGYVRKGDEVEVLDLSSDGRSVLVRKGDRSGWMRASRLTLDEIPQPLHGPAPTTGLSGSVPGQ